MYNSGKHGKKNIKYSNLYIILFQDLRETGRMLGMDIISIKILEYSIQFFEQHLQ
jgi:hypothetical protein